jgi:hypothetical protein
MRRHLHAERGQATLAFVFALSLVLATGAGILADNVIQHDPLVQNDVVSHYAYRALEAGINTFLSNVNGNANQIGCSSTTPTGGQCTAGEYQTWKQVEGTTGPGVIPEWYLWDNPVFCFTESCTGSHPAAAPVLYVKVTIYGAAGFPGHIYYQSSTTNLQPENGFLDRVWWSNYEATDPALSGDPQSDCTQDWNNAYNGPDTTGTPACGAVYFGPSDQIYGPIFSNDSIYVAGDPTLGPVQTHDPNCLFVTGTGGESASCEKTGTAGGRTGQIVKQTATAAAGDSYNVPEEPLPVTNSALAAYAALGGCLYKGPTTIEFDTSDEMTVWSPDSSATSRCPTGGSTAVVPNGANGNGVIYVESQGTASLCAAGANPFDDYTSTSKANGTKAQWGYKGSYYNFFGWQPQPDCEGDAFVSDNPHFGGISGQLTVASSNNIVVTGNLEYLDCGSTFNSTVTHPCPFSTTGTNDVLGLIATNYIEVNHPVVPSCQTTRGRNPVTTCTGVNQNSSPEPLCATATLGTPAAALCNPGPVTIDAAVLALNHSFTVNNEGLLTATGTSYGVGSAVGTLTVYGSMDQNWRGAVGIFDTAGIVSGYSKDYDWDGRIAIVSPPHYLTPGTPSWALTSSAINLSPAAPACCAAP